MKTRLDQFDNRWYKPGGNVVKRTLWFCVNMVFFKSSILPFYGLKRSLLRLFGAKIGKGVVIKPCVIIKYPWKLKIGDFTWIGENVWIDNLAYVEIGAHACISQGAYLLTGNHDYKKSTFDLMVKPIEIEDGAWIGAKSIVCPGVKVRSHAVLTAGAVATKSLDAFMIYQGNPAQPVKKREIES
jgi:putative colanic acid biosynthesis acetyltransferase WcaF